MKTSVIALVACLALAGAAVAQDAPKAGALDGKVFSGDLGKTGDKKHDKDQLTFKNGTFVSSACVAYGFHETPYTATEKDGVVTFSATATNAKGESMVWNGTVKQGMLEATAVNKTPSGDTTYGLKGKMGAAAAAAKPHKSEHPEHPK